MNEYNVLIIGAGNKGALSDAPGSGNEHKYLSYAHAVKDHPGFELCGFSDYIAHKRYEADKIWQPSGIKDFNDLIIIIATNDDVHYENLIEYSKRKPILVICEKPLCTDVSQAREIVELYKSKGIPLMVDYTRRFIPKWQKIKVDIDAGLYGKFIKGYCYFNRGWKHTASHFIDHALWYNGTLDNIRIEKVEATYQWVYQWGLFYEKDFAYEHAVNFTKEKVDSIYDKHLWYVMDNAYNFLEGKEPLLCTGEDALRSLEETYRMMEVEA